MLTRVVLMVLGGTGWVRIRCKADERLRGRSGRRENWEEWQVG